MRVVFTYDTQWTTCSDEHTFEHIFCVINDPFSDNPPHYWKYLRAMCEWREG